MGGLREKIIGAKTAGVKTVVVPRRNEPDVEELPESMIRGLKIVFASDLEEAVVSAIGPIPSPA